MAHGRHVFTSHNLTFCKTNFQIIFLYHLKLFQMIIFFVCFCGCVFHVFARFHWQPSCKIASSIWMEVSLQEATAAISLQSISGDQKGAGEEHSKGTFHTPLEGWQNRKDTFNCKLFSVSYSSCLSANEAEAILSSSDLRWWHTSMAAD